MRRRKRTGEDKREGGKHGKVGKTGKGSMGAPSGVGEQSEQGQSSYYVHTETPYEVRGRRTNWSNSSNHSVMCVGPLRITQHHASEFCHAPAPTSHATLPPSNPQFSVQNPYSPLPLSIMITAKYQNKLNSQYKPLSITNY